MMNGNPNPFAAHLEALDQKAGRVHTINDWHRIGATAQHTPEALTDDDLVILSYFSGAEPAARARARRVLARNPPPPAPMTTKSIETTPLPPTPAGQSHDSANAKADTGDFDLAAFLAGHGTEAVTLNWLFKHEDVVADEIIDEFKKRDARMKELETRQDAQDAEIAALKAMRTLKDAGIWRHGSTYALGDVMQFDGSAWVCTKAHTATSSVDHSCWRLWIKRGKDGKDVRP